MKGEYLKAKVKETGLPITKVAEKLGISSQNMQMYFKAEDVRSSTLERLSEVLGLSIAWFYGQEMREQTNEQLLSLLRDKDKQIDRLLGIIEAMSGAAKKDTA